MKITLISTLLLLAQFAFGNGNPFVRHIFTADPSAHVWKDGRLYVYPSQDQAPPRGCDRMDKYHVFSTDDMVTWTDHGQIVEAADVPWDVPILDDKGNVTDGTFMWAPDCAYKNGTYYFYFPHPAGPSWNDTWQIGIAVSDQPASDFTVLDKPLGGIPEKGGHIDPCIFIDDDGQAYFYYGGGNSCLGGKLKDNMIELDGELQRMTGLYDFHEAAWIFKRNGIYYLAYADNASSGNRLRYAISDNPLGPWTHKGIYLQSVSSYTSHGSIVEFKGKWYAFYHSADLSRTGELRSICVDELFFNEDGTIQMVVQTKDQGSPYMDILKTTNDIIEAEEYNDGKGYYSNGQGIAYWSTMQGVNGGMFRKEEKIVVLENRRSGIRYITNTNNGEYINYTVEVSEAGVYDIDFAIGAVDQNPETKFYIGFDWVKATNPRKYTAPYAQVTDLPVVTIPDIDLTKGIHTLNFYPQGNLNFDKFSFRKTSTSAKKTSKEEIKLYPNPSDGLFQVSVPATGTITISDVMGRLILKENMNDVNHTVDLTGHAAGVYILAIQSGGQIYQTNVIKK